MRHVPRGFTLIELLVVVCIILILAALLAVLSKDVRYRARVKDTQARIHALDYGCKTYRMEFGGSPSSTTPYPGSKNLHFTLGMPRREYGCTVGPRKPQHPYVTIPENWRQDSAMPTFLVDAFGNVLQYQNPHSTKPEYGFRVWSLGEDVDNPVDDMASDIRE